MPEALFMGFLLDSKGAKELQIYLPAGAEPARGAYAVRGGGSRSAGVGGLGVFEAARAGGGVAPLGRARYRPARDLHRYPDRPRAAPPLGGAAPGLRVSPSGHGSRVAPSGARLRFRGPSWVQLRRWWLG